MSTDGPSEELSAAEMIRRGELSLMAELGIPPEIADTLVREDNVDYNAAIGPLRLLEQRAGRRTWEAIARFASASIAEIPRDRIGARWLEIFERMADGLENGTLAWSSDTAQPDVVRIVPTPPDMQETLRRVEAITAVPRNPFLDFGNPEPGEPWDSSIGPEHDEDELPFSIAPQLWVYHNSMLPQQVEQDGEVYELVPREVVQVDGVYMMQRIAGGNLVPIRITDILAESNCRRVISFRWAGDVLNRFWEYTYAEPHEAQLRFLWTRPLPPPTRSRVVTHLEEE